MEGYGKYSIDTFEFENGCVLNDVDVEFSLSGTPKYDADGTGVNPVRLATLDDFDDYLMEIEKVKRLTGR